MNRRLDDLIVSRRDFVKTSAATWGITVLAPYAKFPGATTYQDTTVSGFRSLPLSARPMVLWPWLNGHVDRGQITRELEEMRAKGLRGPIIWDLAGIADPEVRRRGRGQRLMPWSSTDPLL